MRRYMTDGGQFSQYLQWMKCREKYLQPDSSRPNQISWRNELEIANKRDHLLHFYHTYELTYTLDDAGIFAMHAKWVHSAHVILLHSI